MSQKVGPTAREGSQPRAAGRRYIQLALLRFTRDTEREMI